MTRLGVNVDHIATGREARKTVEGRYNIKVVAEATLAFYGQLLSRR